MKRVLASCNNHKGLMDQEASCIKVLTILRRDKEPAV